VTENERVRERAIEFEFTCWIIGSIAVGTPFGVERGSLAYRY